MWRNIIKRCIFRLEPTNFTFLSNKNIKIRRICSTVCKKQQVDFQQPLSVQIKEENQNKISDQIHSNSFTYRSHTCGELRLEDVGQKVTLCGWVQYVRLSKFLLIRDSYGLIQCIIDNESVNISDLPLETIVKIKGHVKARPKNMVNSDMATGEIEVVIENLEVLNQASKVPFNLRNYQKPKEQLRLQHRYIDLRFPEMQSNLRLRSQMLHSMRKFLVEEHSFVEVETPTLFCRTPGGAREFIVPTHHPGLFYSLVQSPQQFKQMLMAGGVDRYFQVARCYRDEATRPDRQPEFTQLDVELSFTTAEGIQTMIEQLLYKTFPGLPRPPFKRMNYQNALNTYGTDKPNLTYDLKLTNLTQAFTQSINLPNCTYALPYSSQLGKLTSKYKEKIKEISKKYDVKIVLNENIHREFGKDIAKQIKQVSGDEKDYIVSMGEEENVCTSLGEIREMIAELLTSKNLLKCRNTIEPLWVVDFPLFVKGENGLETCHHPFTAPHPDDLHLLDTEPLKMRSLAYDIVLNGNEVGGGSVRIHDAFLQERVLKILNIDSNKLMHFMNALRSGCPPHAGIALGIDRLMSIACKVESIRDVIAFPKSHEGKDPLSGAPNEISNEDKKYYHIS